VPNCLISLLFRPKRHQRHTRASDHTFPAAGLCASAQGYRARCQSLHRRHDARRRSVRRCPRLKPLLRRRLSEPGRSLLKVLPVRAGSSVLRRRSAELLHHRLTTSSSSSSRCQTPSFSSSRPQPGSRASPPHQVAGRRPPEHELLVRAPHRRTGTPL
jgi:hypothetical protein